MFCRLSPTQRALYTLLLRSATAEAVLRGRSTRSADSPLQLISLLRMLCNHPFLAMPASEAPASASRAGDAEEGDGDGGRRGVQCGDADDASGAAVAEALRGMGFAHAAQLGRGYCGRASLDEMRLLSGKLCVLARILHESHAAGDKVVVVSTFTSALDLLARACELLQLGYLRLDGATEQSKRQVWVARQCMRVRRASHRSPHECAPRLAHRAAAIRESFQHARLSRVRLPPVVASGRHGHQPRACTAARAPIPSPPWLTRRASLNDDDRNCRERT